MIIYGNKVYSKTTSIFKWEYVLHFSINTASIADKSCFFFRNIESNTNKKINKVKVNHEGKDINMV